jgi:hypothetical protein
MGKESIGETRNSKYSSCTETETMGNLSINGNIILKRILRKREEKVWADSSGTGNLPVAGSYITLMNFHGSTKYGEFLDQQRNY